MIPHFRTALSGPLYPLERIFLEKAEAIEAWLNAQWQQVSPPFYGSVDLRHAGFKLAPVDTNLFPAGFNNLTSASAPFCIQAIRSAAARFPAGATRVLLVPESHTRNPFYFQHLAGLIDFLRQAGLTVRVGSLLPEITVPTDFSLEGGRSLTLEPLQRRGSRLCLADYDPEVILLNNDLSGGIPEILLGLEQKVQPPVQAGWSTRRKSQHFSHYQQVAQEFATLLNIDPWLVDPLFTRCGQINFQARQGEECLEYQVEKMLKQIAAKYREYSISDHPFVIVKADAGTYGMSVMTVRDPAEVRVLNRKQRNKMAVGKDNVSITEVLIQEGVYTLETLDGGIAEPVVYMVDRFVVGSFYRLHTERRRDENLNTPGMRLVPLELENGEAEVLAHANLAEDPANRFYAYAVVARLALLAAGRELATIQSLAAQPAASVVALS